MINSIYHEKLISRAIINLSLKPLTLIHVGARQEGTLKQIVRANIKGKMQPFIPAESLKGTLRALATSISKSNTEIFDSHVKEIIKLHTKDGHKGLKNANMYEIAKNTLLKMEIIDKEQINELSQENVVDLYYSLNCPICLLFGSKEISGKLLFYDAIPNKTPKVNVFNFTSISRDTRTVEEKRLFSIEAIVPEENLSFSTKVIIDNVNVKSNEAKLLSKVINYVLNNHIQVGGLKSKGYGLMEVDREESYVILPKLKEPSSNNDICDNIKALLLKDGYYDKVKLEEYAKMLV